jgi:hypothetical protein
MPTTPDELAALEEERSFLLASLRDLEREKAAGDLDDGDYAALRDDYTSRAANVIRAIDEGRAALPPAPPRRWARLAAVAVGLVLVAVLAGVLVARATGQRQAGGTITGNIDQTVNNQLSEARAALTTDTRHALDLYDQVLEVQPDNTEALAYRGYLVALAGNQAGQNDLVDRGEQSVDRAIELVPSYADAHCFKALIRHYARQDDATARAELDACMAAGPPAVVRSLVAPMQQELAGAPASTAPTATTAAG